MMGCNMTNVVQQVINSLTDEQRLRIIADYHQLEQTGSVGDCLLRSIAYRIADNFGCMSGGLLWMEQVANAAYRNFAERFIDNMDDGK